MKKIVITTILVLQLIFSLIGCGMNSQASNSVNKENIDNKIVRLASAGTQNFMGELAGIAQENKYIEEELDKIGYKVEYINFPAAGPAINEAFVGENIDFASYGDLPPVVLKSKGIDISIIGITNSNYNLDLIVQGDSEINSVKNIKGKKIIVGKGTIYQQYFDRLIKSNDIDEKDVEVINAVADAQSTFLSKNVDGYIASDIAARLLIKQGNAKIVATTLDNPEFTSQTVLVGRNKYIKDNPEVPVALMKALIRAKEFACSNSDEAYKIFSKVGVSEDIIKESYGYDDGKFQYFSLDVDNNSIKKLNELNDFLFEKKLIDKKSSIDELVNNSYYKKALQELGK